MNTLKKRLAKDFALLESLRGARLILVSNAPCLENEIYNLELPDGGATVGVVDVPTVNFKRVEFVVQ